MGNCVPARVVDAEEARGWNLLSELTPDEALRKNTNQCRLNKKIRDPHIQKARDGGWRVICMKRRENKVTCHCRLDRVFRCLKIPHFPYHYDIRILTQNVPQNRSKGNIHRRLDRDLIKFFMNHFNGVFHSRNVDLGR